MFFQKLCDRYYQWVQHQHRIGRLDIIQCLYDPVLSQSLMGSNHFYLWHWHVLSARLAAKPHLDIRYSRLRRLGSVLSKREWNKVFEVFLTLFKVSVDSPKSRSALAISICLYRIAIARADSPFSSWISLSWTWFKSSITLAKSPSYAYKSSNLSLF